MISSRVLFLSFLCASWLSPYPCQMSVIDGINAGDTVTITDILNSIRRGVCPSATNMPILTWDNTLQDAAQMLTTPCKYEKNASLSYGQIISHSGANVATTCEDSYSEDCPTWAASGDCGSNSAFMLVNCERACNACRVFGVTSHFQGWYQDDVEASQQMVLAESRRFGCGRTQCDPLEILPSDIYYTEFLACFFYPTTSLSGDLYEEGASCSNCPADLSDCNDKLCVPVGEGDGEPIVAVVEPNSRSSRLFMGTGLLVLTAVYHWPL